MDEDWGRLATEIKAARLALGMTQKELAAAAGVGYSSLQRLESGHAFDGIPPSAYKVAQVFGWTHESPRLILAGGKPVLVEQAAGPAKTRDRSLPARVEQALAEGELVDTEVLELPGGLTVVVVGRSVGPRSDEEKAELGDALREWTRAQRKLKDIADEA
ncbi:helix-turn-helix transcriptional regulator [Streptomyces sp. NPDC004520]|uniref:helix-turn-helix transcriptional regulator n=1 Tax=Streptomyces sp. NPDC004520 TaxID=3364702 RepID=UPI00368151D5